MFEILLGIIAILYILEGYHDNTIEKVQKTGDIKLVEAWHQADVYFHIMLNIMVSFGIFVAGPSLMGIGPMWIEGVIFGIMLLGFRQLFMVPSLNLFRNREMFYIGTTAKFDKLIKGKEWVVFTLSGILIIVGYLLIKFTPWI